MVESAALVSRGTLFLALHPISTARPFVRLQNVRFTWNRPAPDPRLLFHVEQLGALHPFVPHESLLVSRRAFHVKRTKSRELIKDGPFHVKQRGRCPRTHEPTLVVVSRETGILHSTHKAGTALRRIVGTSTIDQQVEFFGDRDYKLLQESSKCRRAHNWT
jgi:hypothetical protein